MRDEIVVNKAESSGTKVLLVDGLPPEDLAMVQALYSRSPESAEVHLEKVRATGSGAFCQKYYVGYGHRSIGDGADTTLFFEGVSTLAAKAIQDNPLYSGQETSTRYIDMARQKITDPVNTTVSRAVLARWMAFYTESQNDLAAHVRATYPIREGEKPDVYERAVKARVFDILRGFLPAGITTQLSWHTNLRQGLDHLARLDHHPLAEVRRLAGHARALCGLRYESSGFTNVAPLNTEVQLAQDTWRDRAGKLVYFDVVPESCMRMDARLLSLAESIPKDHWDLIRSRPRGCVLPHEFSAYANITWKFALDFGSFRDIQRHRNGVCRMPLLTAQYGFEPWYLKNLGPLKAAGAALVEEQTQAIAAIDASPEDKQYLTALGYLVPCHVSYGLPAALYVMELRSGKMIHPTLRARVLNMVNLFRARFPEIPVHADTEPSDWDVRRGSQTILER